MSSNKRENPPVLPLLTKGEHKFFNLSLWDVQRAEAVAAVLTKRLRPLECVPQRFELLCVGAAHPAGRIASAASQFEFGEVEN